ncbi:hypothetical protein D9C73_018578 [Collichthys lucidus]|uniref:Uncharacterized protein n=1 Tax=Collichthys lucidus TaxID=240159 RepID=A0A4U5V9J3_COLLU|nr:hypothetical protein D9C73_018578 [Collichthys lucidus]
MQKKTYKHPNKHAQRLSCPPLRLFIKREISSGVIKGSAVLSGIQCCSHASETNFNIGQRDVSPAVRTMHKRRHSLSFFHRELIRQLEARRSGPKRYSDSLSSDGPESVCVICLKVSRYKSTALPVLLLGGEQKHKIH